MRKKMYLIFLTVCFLCLITACNNSEEDVNIVNTGSETTVANSTPMLANEDYKVSENVTELGSYSKKTNYIFGEEEYGFDPQGDSTELEKGFCYYIDGLLNAFMISKNVAEYDNESFKYTLHENGYIEINKFLLSDERVEIPSNIDGYTVAYIGKEAFKGSYVKNVVLPDGILAIGEEAFSEVTSLETINFPDSLIVIAEDAFAYCSNLINIKFSESLQAIGERAFIGCSSLTNIEFYSNVRVIAREAFADCINIKNIIFSEGIKQIAADAFQNTDIEELTIPNSIHQINAGAFSNCSNLRKAVLPDVIGDSDNGFGWGIFGYCSKLEEINLPKNITAIMSSSFTSCERLKSIIIPASVEFISSYAFEKCTKLKDVYFETADCEIVNNAFLLDIGLTIHAPKGGSVQKFCRVHPTIKFEATD